MVSDWESQLLALFPGLGFMSELDSVPFYSDHFRVSTPQRPGAGWGGGGGAKSAPRPERPKFPQNARDAPPQPPHPPQIEKFRRPLL